jgi:hypothetical protein
MKRIFLLFLLFLTVLTFAFTQQMPTVGVIDLEARGAGITAADAANITGRIINELSSWGTINVVRGTAGADYLIRGTVVKQGDNYTVAGATVSAANNRVLNEFVEQVPVNSLNVFTLCARAVERVPFPNYLVGTWQSTINMPDGPVVCIIEFKSDRSIHVERYDTWEYREKNALRYEGYGSGTYTYIGYANRTITVNAQQVRVDATFGINLSLEETLPDQTNVNLQGLSIAFNADRTAFDIVNGTLPCGRNYDGPSVHSSEYLGFSRFTKIR